MNINKQFIFIIAFLCVLFLNPVQTNVEAAQDSNLKFENITTEKGLSQNYINCIYQDHYGYIWFGTAVGLNKYDGINFTVYYENADDASAISDSWVNSICETGNGQLWIGTSDGLNVFNRETETFTSYVYDAGDKNSISDNYITAIYEDSRGMLWIGTSDGLNVFNREAGTFTSYEYDAGDKNSISDNYITAIYEDSRGMLWIGTSDGLNVFNRETETFTSYVYDAGDGNSISDNYITAIYEDSRGMLWIGTSDGLNVFNREPETFTAYVYDAGDENSISNNNVLCICEDVYGYIWIGTNYGLNRFDVENGLFYTYFSSMNTISGIASNNIQSSCVDSEGILWFGTSNGVSKLNFNKNVFNYYINELSVDVYGMCSNDNETLWVKTSSSVVSLDLQTHQIENVYTNAFKSKYISELRYNTFCVSGNRYLFSGTMGFGLEVYDIANQKLITYTAEKGNDKSLSGDTITSLYTDDNDVVWIGTTGGLCSYNTGTGDFTQYKDYSDDISGNVWVIYGTADRKMLFATDVAIYMLDNSGKIVCMVDNVSSAMYGTSGSGISILTMYEDNAGRLWIGTINGLCCYDIKNRKFISYEVTEAVSNDWLLSILEDNNGDIWVCTLQGLWKLSIDHSTYTEYDTEDGLQNASFLRGSYETGDGELFFGSMGGLVSFYPENIRRDTTDQAVVINEFNLIDKPISFDKPVEDVTKIVLSYSENSFVIDFVALYYNSPDGIKYAYKLDGFDENWNYCDAGESFTKYTNLNSGEYVFLVKAANSDGVWSDKVDSLTIVISSPFWQKWWFILSMVILLAMIIVLIVRVRTRVLNKHAQNLEKQVYERTQQLTQKSKQLENELKRRAGFSRALVHELKTPLTAVLAASSLLSTELKDEPYKSLARHLNEGANDLNFRINELFDLAKGELGLLRIERRPLDMIKLLSDVVEISKHEAYTKKQNIFLKYDPAESFVVEADELRMRQVIFNLLDNAIKFTPEGGSITIEAGMKELEMLVQVKDTGIGMTKEELKGIFQSYHSKGKHKGYLSGLGLGLSLSKMFIECHGGRIWAESDKGQGSTFTFTLPLSNKVFDQ